MDAGELNSRFMADARRCGKAEPKRSKLWPHREAVIVYRAKGLSYERIAAAFSSQGLAISGPTVGQFCRTRLTTAEVLRERRQLEAEERRADLSPPLSPPRSVSPASFPMPGRRGPKIARDDF